MKHYKKLWKYVLTGQYSRWNLVSFIFLVCCNVDLICQRIKRKVPEFKRGALIEMELIMYKKNPLLYTQVELLNTLRLLAKRWNRIEYREEIVESWLDCLEYRARDLILCINGTDVLDGKNDRDRVKIEHPNKKVAFRCSIDYVSDISTLVTSFRNRIAQRFYVCDSDNYQPLLTDSGVNDDDNKKRYVISAMLKGFSEWVDSHTDVLQGSEFKKDLVSSVISYASVIPGERERYSRYNGGIEGTDSMSVVDMCKPGILHGTWWTSKCLDGGIKKVVKDKDTDPLVRSIAVAKAFHFTLFTEFDFPWWDMCIFWEEDIMDQLDTLKLCGEEPMVLQSMGEFNVYYRGTMYRTISIEKAIIMWCVLIITLQKGVFTDKRFKTHGLQRLKGIVEEWEGKGKKEKVENKRETDSKTVVKRRGVFFEAEDI
jgi:hypothetical protein